MAVFQINLIRERTIPARRRKAIFWGVSVYLVLCIALLAFVANHATRRLLATRRLRHEIVRLENQFQLVYPGMHDILAFARQSEQKLTAYARDLESIDAFLADRLNLSGLLASLKAPLPEGVHLFNLDLDQDDKTLSFDIVLPAGSMESSVNGARLANFWNADEVLMSQAGRIRSVAAQRNRVQNQQVMILRFTTALDGREG